ncbi:MAG: hypothetical protein ACREQI_15760 [Candidatus Binataceae bacterium]
MKSKMQIHVGENAAAAGRRFISAWRALEAGRRVRERHLSFESLEGLVQLLTPKRWELLQHVHRHPARSIRSLSLELKRDYRRVHDDVETLAGVGLLERDGRGACPRRGSAPITMRSIPRSASPARTKIPRHRPS